MVIARGEGVVCSTIPAATTSRRSPGCGALRWALPPTARQGRYEQMRTLGYLHLFDIARTSRRLRSPSSCSKLRRADGARRAPVLGLGGKRPAISSPWYYWNAVGQPQRPRSRAADGLSRQHLRRPSASRASRTCMRVRLPLAPFKHTEFPHYYAAIAARARRRLAFLPRASEAASVLGYH